jgi:tripartite-type tricarboxylate transporter receptor subunit TctC
MLAPARTPRNLVSRIHRDVAHVANIVVVRDRFASQGLELHASAPADFAAYLAREVTTWKEVVRKANIKAD